MKKSILIILLITLCLSAFAGCDSNSEYKQMYIYVNYVDSSGFAGSVNDIGMIYIQFANANKEIKPCDTVTIKYSENNMVKKTGYFIGLTGTSVKYEYVINDPVSVHVNDGSKGDLVFD